MNYQLSGVLVAVPHKPHMYNTIPAVLQTLYSDEGQ